MYTLMAAIQLPKYYVFKQTAGAVAPEPALLAYPKKKLLIRTRKLAGHSEMGDRFFVFCFLGAVEGYGPGAGKHTHTSFLIMGLWWGELGLWYRAGR